MAQFSVNTARFDPYRNFKFKIKWSVDRANLGEAKLWNADLRGANLD